jgi:hypothetical protein
MGTLIFVCPTTGHQVSSGVEVDRSSYKSLPRTQTAIFCPRCRENHLLSSIWAWLDSNDPKVVVTDEGTRTGPVHLSSRGKYDRDQESGDTAAA